ENGESLPHCFEQVLAKGVQRGELRLQVMNQTHLGLEVSAFDAASLFHRQAAFCPRQAATQLAKAAIDPAIQDGEILHLCERSRQDRRTDKRAKVQKDPSSTEQPEGPKINRHQQK